MAKQKNKTKNLEYIPSIAQLRETKEMTDETKTFSEILNIASREELFDLVMFVAHNSVLDWPIFKEEFKSLDSVLEGDSGFEEWVTGERQRLIKEAEQYARSYMVDAYIIIKQRR